MARFFRREVLLSLVPVTTAGCVFQEGDWGTTVRIANKTEDELMAHVEIVSGSNDELVYEKEQPLQGGEENEEQVTLQTESNNLHVAVETDERKKEEDVKSGSSEIWVWITDDVIDIGGSHTM